MVVSEEWFSAGVRGCFTTLAQAIKWADIKADEKGCDYIIIKTKLDDPSTQTIVYHPEPEAGTYAP